MNAPSATTISALRSASSAARPSALSNAGSTFSSRHALSGASAPSIRAAVWPPSRALAPTSWAPTAFAPSHEPAEARTGLLGDPAREAFDQRRACGVLAGGVAEQHGLALAALAARRRSPWPRRSALASRRRGDPLRRGDRGGDRRQRLGPRARRRDDARPHRHQPVVAQGMDAHHLGALLRRLADALREERMVLAQERADDEDALEVAERCDRSAEPADRAALAADSPRAAGCRCSRCRARARAWRAGAAPRPCSSARRARRCSAAPWSTEICVRPRAT